ncbi:MAG TPA: diacylglycerol kinase family protein [Ilumatobacteraceae bacterium]|nr:diacylglycerol kinase family protein [Ilumatobacteraceae bacterium]
MRIRLVVNAFASSVTARNTVVVHQVLSRGNDVDVVETNRRGHATRFSQDAARQGFDVVIGYGGDGTLNEVATGVAGTNTALGVLPGGSTNVFARTLGMPNDPVEAVHLLAAGIARNDIEPIGLGHVNGRYFCFHTGVGFDAAVVNHVERHGSLKRWAGHPLFIYAAMRTMANYDRTQPHFEVITSDSLDSSISRVSTSDAATGRDRDPVEGYFTIVLNTNPYTYLGNRPLDIAPSATLDNGLVVVTFRSLAVTAVLRGLSGALRGGGVKPSATLDVQTDVEALRITASEPFPYQLDGDYLGELTSLDFRHVPAAVRLVRPVLAPG